MKYLNYNIEYNTKSIPTRSFDWDFWADGYDGAPDSGDIRCGTGSSIEDCIEQIEEIELELIERTLN